MHLHAMVININKFEHILVVQFNPKGNNIYLNCKLDF